MGWCSATDIFDDIVGEILNPTRSSKNVIKKLIETLEDMDWDCQYESDYFDHPLINEIFKEIHPDWFDDIDK
jgi:hypothetical protein